VEVLVGIIIFIFVFLAYFLTMRIKKAIADKRNDRKIIKARKAIEDAGYLLGIEYLAHDLLYKGIIDINLSLNCKELNDLNIDRVIESLDHHSVNHMNEGLPINETVCIWFLLGICYIRERDFHKAINFLTRLGPNQV